MIALTRALDFPLDQSCRTVCEYYLRLLEIKNRALYLHSLQVANYAVSTGVQLGLSKAEVSRLKMAALLHDIGKLAVPNLILNKFPYLSTRELQAYKRHPIAGASMLENMPAMAEVALIIGCHHERWDGKGFPRRLKGQNSPIGSSIIAVCDYYDRYLNPCVENYRRDHSQALLDLNNLAGQAFDPLVVRAFAECLVTRARELAERLGPDSLANEK